MGHHQLDELDYKILKLIAANARIPFLEVARECNVSGAAIHQRVQKLTNLGILKGSEYIIDSNKIGFETCAYMGFYLKNPGDFEHVVEDYPHQAATHRVVAHRDVDLFPRDIPASASYRRGGRPGLRASKKRVERN